MGVLDLRIFNMALMVKWWWRLVNRSQRPLQTILCSKYGSRSSSWNSKPQNSTNVSPFWKKVLLSRSLLWPSISFKIRNGRTTGAINGAQKFRLNIYIPALF